MKLRKVLSLLVAFAMIVTASTAMAFTDVAVDSEAYEAVTGLSALKILEGKGEGIFEPEGKVKRSEMAAIIMRALGVNTSARANTIFTDVSSDHWASGAIAEAFGAGIINGRSLQYAADGVTPVSGRFDPDAEVTVDEAVKMIVAAMGYNLKAESMVKPGVNPFPTAYNLIADQKGITDGVEKTVGGASRGTIAQLVWNALPVELMEQTEWGSDETFKEVTDKSLLFSKQRAVLMEAKITNLSLDPEEKMINFSSVALDDVATNNYKVNTTGSTTSYVDYTKFTSLDKGACEFAGLQGLKVKVLVDIEDTNNYEVIAVFPAASNKTLTVDAPLFKQINGNVIEYYKTADSSTLNKSSKIEGQVTVYSNLIEVPYGIVTPAVPGVDANGDGDYTDPGDTAPVPEVRDTPATLIGNVASLTSNPGNTTLRFVDTDNNGYYDTLFVDNYASFVVGSVDAEAYNIMGSTANSIYNSYMTYTAMNKDYDYDLTLDPESTTVDWVMTDEAGKELTVADVNVGDVITYAMSYDGTNYFYDITVCKASAVTGTIDQVKEVKNRVDGNTYYFYTIDGKDYQLNQSETNANASKLNAGESGTFQITANGKIIAVTLDEAVRNFAAVVGFGAEKGSFNKDLQMMVMKADGSVETLSFADEYYNNNTTTKTTESTVLASADTNTNDVPDDVDTLAAAVLSAGKVVMFELNSKGEVKGLYYGAGIATKTSNDYKYKSISGAYAQASERLAGEYLVDSSAIIAADTTLAAADKKKEFSAITKGSFLDGDTYTGTVVVDENREVVFALVENFKVYPAYDSAPMYVTGKSVVSVDDSERTKLFGIVGNDAVEYVLAEDYDVVEMGRSNDTRWTTDTGLDTLSKKALVEGDVIQFTVNGAGEIDAYRPLVKVDGTAIKFLAVAGMTDMSNSTYENNAKVASTATPATVKLYSVSTNTGLVLDATAIQNGLTNSGSYPMYDGFGVVGHLNRISGNNVGLFAYAGTPYAGSTDAQLKEWLSNNYVDVAGNANVYTFVNSDSDSYADGYTVKTLAALKTYNSTGALNKTDDVLYIFKYDGEVVLQYAVDVKADNK